MRIPRIVIAGTNSGCGKTTVVTGILAALVRKGMKAQPFKVGPDYIDPMFHTYITQKYSRNLDSWMLSENILSYLFCKNALGADIAVIEGVMGIYDGYGGYSKDGSTAHVAKILHAPVILVVNGEGMSLSAVAMIKGFMEFDSEVKIKGVIINNIKSESHFTLLKEVIETHTGVSVVGYLKKDEEYSLPSRHLGLVPDGEVVDLKEKVSLLAAQLEKTVDLELLVKIANQSDDIEENNIAFNIARRNINFKIAVAMDSAFNFYYRDNIELLEMLGAELHFFSPINDSCLPPDIDGLYIGGGYPEVWGKQLQDNVAMREDIKKNILNGLPSYAECGGLMYLTRSIKLKDGQEYEMVGAISGRSEMTRSLQRFGYVDIEVIGDNVISKKGYRIRAHEFHYSDTMVDWDVPACYRVTKSLKGKEAKSWVCGYKLNNLLAAYPHLHFWANTGFAENFINSCINYRVRRLQHEG